MYKRKNNNTKSSFSVHFRTCASESVVSDDQWVLKGCPVSGGACSGTPAGKKGSMVSTGRNYKTVGRRLRRLTFAIEMLEHDVCIFVAMLDPGDVDTSVACGGNCRLGSVHLFRRDADERNAIRHRRSRSFIGWFLSRGSCAARRDEKQNGAHNDRQLSVTHLRNSTFPMT